MTIFGYKKSLFYHPQMTLRDVEDDAWTLYNFNCILRFHRSLAMNRDKTPYTKAHNIKRGDSLATIPVFKWPSSKKGDAR